ncbi:PREDICTED: putative pentatricopeptide repeat-containing protein At1g17630 [Nelumbo nucifera]|uniref:Pentatricopeptide repeat-containing protein At1g17630 n=2 Tax=Nelumbo nucifera TaxID=4432 RepID=A0A1U8AA64_NELNU|nr:PREDICTED: putative pentatricopeptide repeat-containing protein At1g17630 [Nelumbo nucifera]DAD44401.1 TPA_asm: hypothetical protein HUJ06_002631 [Nelumbo nucifera]
MIHGSRRLISVPVSVTLRPNLPLRFLFRSSQFCSTVSHYDHQSPIEFGQILFRISSSRNNNNYYYNCTVDKFDHLLQQCTTVQQSKQIHAQIILFGTYGSAFLAARLVSVYSRFGLLSDALEVFRSVPIECNSGVLLWNSILRANIYHGHWEEALSLYMQMRKFGIAPDGFTLPLVLRACASTGNLVLCKNIHSHAVLLGLQFHLHVANQLVNMYGKIGRMDYARQLFDRMPCRTVLSWNTMISGFSLNYDCDGALEMFGRMESEGFEPNLVTWTSLLSAHSRCGQHEEVMRLFDSMRMRSNGSTAEAVAVVLSACANSYSLDKGKEIHGYVITSGFQDYAFVQNSLISMYGKHGDIEDAKKLFSEIKVKSLVSWNAMLSSYVETGFCDEALELFSYLENTEDNQLLGPNLISWSTLIDGLSSKGQRDESLELFRRMLHFGVMPNSITVASILSVCADLAVLGLGKEIHGHVVRSLMDKNILVGNGLVNMYTKCGSLKQGRLVFDKIGSRDVISWNTIIAGYGLHGFGRDSINTFDEMIRAGFKPDGITFVAVLSACSHSGLLNEGRGLFGRMMDEFMILPQMEHYACMVDLLGRGGLLQEASELVKTMPMVPNSCVWGALLNSCRIYGNTEVAKETASQIFSLESETSGSYMLLSNIYAACGRWDDSAEVRVLAKMKGLKKSPGHSWIEVKKKVYMFSSGSSLPPGFQEVYGVLKDLCQYMESKGYIPDKSFVLQDVDEEEKRQILYGHSEKLAIAFGHANIPPSMPIRVMKNLRVCGDCHNWTKFFSKVTTREVIVRDGRRFHHFMDGLCSCNDFW